MPGRDEVGQAAHNYVLAQESLRGAEKAVEEAKKTLISVMKAYDRKSVKLPEGTFTRRLYLAKETIVVS